MKQITQLFLEGESPTLTHIYPFTRLLNLLYTAWKVPVFGVILVHIFPHSDWIRGDTPYLSVFSSNTEKCGPQYLRIRTLFTQCYLYLNDLVKTISIFFLYITLLRLYSNLFWVIILISFLPVKMRSSQKMRRAVL